MHYADIVARRKALQLDGYKTLADVGFDGDWVSPYQMAAASKDGPVLVGLHWLDAPSVEANRSDLHRLGYLPKLRFNQVVDRALQLCGLHRGDLYVTQVFHLLPMRQAATIPAADVDSSFDAVTRHELTGRRVIALGSAAARACGRHAARCRDYRALIHPSSRGLSHEDKAVRLAAAITAIRQAG